MEGCEQYAELISARLDGPLSPEEERVLNAHLEQCPDCQALAEDLNALHEALTEPIDPPAPPELLPGVMERVRQTAPGPRRVRRYQVRTLAGLAACLAICFGLYHSGWLRVPPETAVPQSTGAAESLVDSVTTAPPDSGPAPEEMPESKQISPASVSNSDLPVGIDSVSVDGTVADDVEPPEATLSLRAAQFDGASLTVSGHEVDAVCTLSQLPQGAEEVLQIDAALQEAETEQVYYLVSREQLDALMDLAQAQEDVEAELAVSESKTGLCAVVLQN